MFRVLKDNGLAVSFNGWNRIGIFMQAWKAAGLRVVGHIVLTKPYASKSAFVGYKHESAYVLAKGRPVLPSKPLPDVMPWEYTGKPAKKSPVRGALHNGTGTSAMATATG